MRTERGLDRFVTFLDAVVAIAITLLVLPLVDVLGGRKPAEIRPACSPTRPAGSARSS
ncbi:hypothetical protein [Pseudonocardia sp. T1-2H]|uniref:hypothetical protein n=1 Tax=Pseudonocardia sp. T1-2H TaxID=3128899 RepID=UPI003100AB86